MGNKSKTDSKLPTEKAGKPNMSKKKKKVTPPPLVGQNATGSEVQSKQPPQSDTTALLEDVCGVQG